jgi:hypothetical protein
MKDGRDGLTEREMPRRRASDRKGSGPRKQRGFVERATAQGHSGQGSESVLPHLRDQLRLKALMPVPYPTPEFTLGKDEHHQ